MFLYVGIVCLCLFCLFGFLGFAHGICSRFSLVHPFGLPQQTSFEDCACFSGA